MSSQKETQGLQFLEISQSYFCYIIGCILFNLCFKKYLRRIFPLNVPFPSDCMDIHRQYKHRLDTDISKETQKLSAKLNKEIISKMKEENP